MGVEGGQREGGRHVGGQQGGRGWHLYMLWDAQSGVAAANCALVWCRCATLHAIHIACRTPQLAFVSTGRQCLAGPAAPACAGQPHLRRQSSSDTLKRKRSGSSLYRFPLAINFVRYSSVAMSALAPHCAGPTTAALLALLVCTGWQRQSGRKRRVGWTAGGVPRRKNAVQAL